MNFILWSLLVAVCINLLMFIPAYLRGTDKLTDLSYSITFVVLAIFGFWHSNQDAGHLLLFLMVMVWALRLGGFLFIRIRKMKKDSRFDQMRQSFSKFGRFWLFQGLTVFVVLIGALSAWDQPTAPIGVLSYIGWVVFGLGLALETIADLQKYRFNNNKTTDTWIDVGFWRVSRHPNYLGEIMVWIGVYLFIFPFLDSTTRLLALASPVYITSILLFFSGIPLVEKAADKKWGQNKEYVDYKKQVPVLVPTIESLNRLK